MKIIEDAHAFNGLLKKDKFAALKELKDKEGNYIEDVQIGAQKYKVFSEEEEVTPLFMKKKAGQYNAFVVCDINYKSKKVIRSDFRKWYFIGNVSFNNTEFCGNTNFDGAIFANGAVFMGTKFCSKVYFVESLFIGKANFSAARFRNDVNFSFTEFCSDANFWGTNFDGIANFWGAKFSGHTVFRKAGFNGSYARFRNSLFTGYTNFASAHFGGDAYFKKARFNGGVSFPGAKFTKNTFFWFAEFTDNAEFGGALFSGDLSFSNAIFKERCDLRVKSFGSFVDFRGTEFRASVFINGAELCKGESKLSFPDKVIVKEKGVEKLYESKENLHATKQIFNKVAYYEEEEHFYYWYKVYDRKCKPWTYFLRPLDWLFFDKITCYFTKPATVFFTMWIVIVLFWGIYVYANIFPESIGHLSVFVNSEHVTLIEHTQGWRTLAFWRDTFYFDIITFTTIGYGDIHPTGWLKLIAGFEGLMGVILMPTFLVILTKKVLW